MDNDKNNLAILQSYTRYLPTHQPLHPLSAIGLPLASTIAMTYSGALFKLSSSTRRQLSLNMMLCENAFPVRKDCHDDDPDMTTK